jgi:hypothetical protein
MLLPLLHALARRYADRLPVFRRVFVVVALAVAMVSAGASAADAATPASRTATAPRLASTTVRAPAYAYYYLWWSTQHWHNKLGSAFPYGAKPLPLPATLAPSGCPPRSLYPGNQLTDVPAALFTQDDAAVIERDVRLAASSGLSGFLVNWKGTGQPGQTTQHSTYSRRLAAMAAAVRRVQADGIPFHLWLSLKASATVMTPAAITNDLDYLQRTFARDPAFDRSHGGRIVLVWNGSRKYSLTTVRNVSARFRSKFFLMGDETAKSWPDGRAASLDGNAYYWSSQDPYRNPASFTQLRTLARMVRSSGSNPDGSAKVWVAPFTPGYSSVLLGGSTCVPRNNGDTMRRLFRGNSPTNPDSWALISWNEVAEGTYVQPLRRYGNRDLAVIKELLTGAG